MKRNITTILVILLSLYYNNSFCGVYDKLNSYKYIITPPFEDKDNASEQNKKFYSDIKKVFKEKGIIIVEDSKQSPEELTKNPSLAIYFSLKIETNDNGFKAVLSFKNYKEKTILEKSYLGNKEKNVQIIFNEFVSEVSSFAYKYKAMDSLKNEIEKSDFDILNGFKYIMMPPIKTKYDYQADFYNELIEMFKSKGIKVETKEYLQWSKELKDEPGLGIFFNIDFIPGNRAYKTIITCSDIKDNVIYKKEYTEDSKDLQACKLSVLSQIREDLKTYTYAFDQDKVIKQKYNEAQIITQDIEKVKSYFETKKNTKKGEGFELTPLEGVYVDKQYSQRTKTYFVNFTIGIIKSYSTETNADLLRDLSIKENDVVVNYKIVVIQSVSKIWKPGEVRGDLFLVKQKKDIFYLRGKWYDESKKIIKTNAEADLSKKIINIEDVKYEKIK